MQLPPAARLPVAHVALRKLNSYAFCFVIVRCRFTNNVTAASSEAGGRGSLFFEGRFYDNVESHQIGQTALSWKKPKLRFKVPSDDFKCAGNAGLMENDSFGCGHCLGTLTDTM